MSRVTVSDKDREAARLWLREYHTADTDANLRRKDSLAEAIATARAEGRREALEALLGVVEPWCDKSKWRRPTEEEACRLASFICTHADRDG